jgi:hypothetical protein
VKSKEVKTGCNLAESSKVGCAVAQKGAVLSVMMMMIGREHPICPSTYFISKIVQRL